MSNDLSYRFGHGGCPEGVLVPPGDMYGCMDKVNNASFIVDESSGNQPSH
jgi:hypothetical protein